MTRVDEGMLSDHVHHRCANKCVEIKLGLLAAHASKNLLRYGHTFSPRFVKNVPAR